MYGHHVNNRMAPLLTKLRQYLLSLIRSYEVIGQDPLYILNTLLNDCLIV